MSLDELFDALSTDHATVAPQVARIHRLLRERGEAVRSHHVALRTFDAPEVDIEALDRAFVAAGYEAAHGFELPGLIGYSYEHRDDRRPRLLISALLVDELSAGARSLIRELVASLEPGAAAHPGFAVSGRRWPLSASTYQQLRAESEYAAWVAAFGFRAHHIAVDADRLRLDAPALDQFLLDSGCRLDPTAAVEAAPLDPIVTSAEDVDVDLGGETVGIPSCPCVFVRPSGD